MFMDFFVCRLRVGNVSLVSVSVELDIRNE